MSCSKKHSVLDRALPWLAGAGMGIAHISVSSNCTLPTQGRCSNCGSCVLAIVALVSWAMHKKRQADNDGSQTE